MNIEQFQSDEIFRKENAFSEFHVQFITI